MAQEKPLRHARGDALAEAQLCPTGHRWQAVLPWSVVYQPDAHAKQEDCFVSGWFVPGEHIVQANVPLAGFENVPLGQS